MINFIKTLIFKTNPVLIAGLVSVIALTTAFIAQYIFALEPCILCIYERYPYGVLIILMIIALLKNNLTPILTIIAGLTALFNAGLSFFHVGVEQKWWAGTDSCGTKMPEIGATIDEIRAMIMNAPTARCDEIPFELFGISMAGYNGLLCLGLALYLFMRFKMDKTS